MALFHTLIRLRQNPNKAGALSWPHDGVDDPSDFQKILLSSGSLQVHTSINGCQTKSDF